MEGNMNPVSSVSPEENRKENEKKLEKLCPGSTFKLDSDKMFVFLSNFSEEEISVIDLDEINMSRIISGKSCSASILKIKDIIDKKINIVRL
uniref:Uncharacterized protein n=1 Tax=candidate division CPR3 bacterium TaxID=2268181 RepID=A0A7C4R518_UNCC3